MDLPVAYPKAINCGVISSTPSITALAEGTAPLKMPGWSPGCPRPQFGTVKRLTTLTSLNTLVSFASDVAVTLVIPLTASVKSKLRATDRGEAFGEGLTDGDGAATSTLSNLAKCRS